jgi:hypothetical protein
MSKDINIWYEINCTSCNASNMVYGGDPDDQTIIDPECVKCYKCGCINFLNNIDEEDDQGEYDVIEPHSDTGMLPPRDYEKFEDLPITFDDYEINGEWRRRTTRTGTISDLLKIWIIDDPYEDSQMAQVLRHLRRIMNDT